MTQPGSQDPPPPVNGTNPSTAHRNGRDRVSGRSLWWLWSLTIAAAGVIVTAWAEQQFQRGVPVILGGLGGFIIGAIEASLLRRRLGSRTGLEVAPHLILAGAGTVLSLTLVLSAALLPSIECAIAAVLCALAVGFSSARGCQSCYRKIEYRLEDVDDRTRHGGQ